MGLLGPRGSKSRPTGSQGVKGQKWSVQGDQGVGLEGPRGSRGRPKGSQGVKGRGKLFHRINSDI